MIKRGIGVNYSNKRLLRKYLIILFSIVLIFSPFSSLWELVYAEGESEEGNTVEMTDLVEENKEGDSENSKDKTVEDNDGGVDIAEVIDESETDKDEGTDNHSSSGGEDESLTVDKAEDEKAEETVEGIMETDNEPQIQAFGDVQPLANGAGDYEYTSIPGQGTTIIKYNGNDTHVTIPKTLGTYNVRFIAESAFEGKNIEAVTIPGGVKEIGNRAFANNKLSEVIITNKEVKFGTDVFAGNQTSPGDFTIYGLNGSTAATYANKNRHTFEAIDQSDFHFDDNFDGTVTITGYSGTDTEVEIPDQILGKDVIAIGRSAFREAGISKVTIPDSVKTIEVWAFYSSGLQSVDLGNGVETIEEWAFYNNNIKELFIPSSLTALENEPFRDNPFEKIEVDSTNAVYKDVDMKGLYSNDGEVLYVGTTAGIIVDGTKRIANDAFHKISIGSVEIPNSVEEIGEWAFYDASLTTVELGTGVKTIGANAFRNNAIEEITIPGNVKEIKLWAFSHNTVPLKVNFNEGLKSIENYAFNETVIKDIILPDGVTSIEYGAFKGSQVENLRLPEGLTTLGYESFSGHQLSEINIPNGLTEIKDYTFTSSQSVGIELTIPESLEKIADEAFTGNLFNRITVNEANDVFKDIDGKGLYTKDGKKIILGTTAGVIASDTEKIGANAFFNQLGNRSTIHIPESVKIIGESAFELNSLTHIQIPGTVDEIDSHAFGHNQLEEIHLHEGLEKIESDAFTNNLLRTVDIPSTVESIGGDAFYENRLEQVIIRSINVSIHSDAFLYNQNNPADLMIYGYKGSDVETFAVGEGYSFKPFLQYEIDSKELLYFEEEDIIEIIDKNGEIVATLQIPDYDNVTSDLSGAHVIINSVDDDDITASGLEVAGAVIDIAFVEDGYDPGNPNEDLILEVKDMGEFILSLLVHDNAIGEISMYHETGQDDWDNVGGKIVDGFITATVTDFSKYGVFAMKEEEPTLIDIPVEKVWKGKAQEFVTVHLLADGVKTDTIELSDKNDWQHIFLEYPSEDGDGNTITYTVAEELVEGYETVITGSVEEGFVITNTELAEEPSLIDIPVEKVWKGKAQEFVTVHLLANGEIVDSIELSELNEWKHTFLEYPLEDNEGNIVTYTVEEDLVEGYETSITGSAGEGFIVINTEILEEPVIDPCESQDPLASGCPEEEIEDETEGSDDEKTPIEGKLPKTATNTFNVLFAGIVLLLLGGTTGILATRRKSGLKE